MVNETTSFKKKGKGKKKGNFKKNSKQVAAQEKKPSLDLSLKLSASTASRLDTGSGTAPSIWRIKDGKVNKGICDIHVIDVYLTNSSTSVFDTGSVANICNSKQGLRIKRRLAKDEVTMCMGNGSKVDVIAVGTYLYIYLRD